MRSFVAINGTFRHFRFTIDSFGLELGVEGQWMFAWTPDWHWTLERKEGRDWIMVWHWDRRESLWPAFGNHPVHAYLSQAR